MIYKFFIDPEKDLAIVKITGNCSLKIAKLLSKTQILKEQEINELIIYDPNTDKIIDKCYILNIPPRKSFTGERIVEFHCWNGLAAIPRFKSCLENIKGIKKGSIVDFLSKRQKHKVTNLYQTKSLSILANSNCPNKRKEATYFLNLNFENLYIKWHKKLTSLIETIDNHKQLSFSYERIYQLTEKLDILTNQIFEHIDKISGFLNNPESSKNKTLGKEISSKALTFLKIHLNTAAVNKSLLVTKKER